MRSALLLVLLSVLTTALQAQRNLSGSARTSAYTYVYSISPEESKKLVRKGMEEFKEKTFLHTLVDSFLTIAHHPALKPGNYLLVKAEEEKLQIEQYTAGNIFCKLIRNNYDLQLFIHNENGQPVTNGIVTIRNKKIPLDAATGVYKLSRYKKQGLVEANVDGVQYFFKLDNRGAGQLPKSGLARLFGRSGAKKINWRRNAEYFRTKTLYEDKFSGFMVFSKPMYKPGDTVKFKAWIIPSKGKPVNRPLILRLTSRQFYTDTILATIQPYRPGGYEYSFVLSDSLDIDLDEEYLLTLEEESSKKFDVNAYDGDLDEDEYAMKRQVLMRNSFNYEEYELESITFKARTDKTKHNRNSAVSLFVKATDENQMTVMDGRVKVVIKPDIYRARFHDSTVFLPDTLWMHEQPMDAVGETKINIPDSIFPAASFGYRIDCTFLNSNNERNETNVSLEYLHQQQMLDVDQQKDSLLIQLIENGKDARGTAKVIAFNSNKDTLQQFSVHTPASLKIDPFVWEYKIIAGDSARYRPKQNQEPVVCYTTRTRDSVFIQISNPQGLPCWYTIFAGKKMIEQGRGNTVNFSERTHSSDPWFVSIQYISGDAVQSLEYSIPYEEKSLQVSLQQPEFIYPGQQATLQLDVKDRAGNPVADADVTLFGFTSKFKNAREPDVPYYGKDAYSRKVRNLFSIGKVAVNATNRALDWQHWSERLGLDSIQYFKFLYPDSIYVNREPAQDSLTQVAPFVVSKGVPEVIHMLYIDDLPYFFNGAQHWKQYSFTVAPGMHSLRLRIHNKQVHAKVMVEKGMKTIVSINADSTSFNTSSEKMPDTLTRQEQLYWDRYLILVERNYASRLAYVQQNDNYMLLNLEEKDRYAYQPLKLIGPLHNSSANFTLKGRFTQSFLAEGSYQYVIEEGLVKMKQLPPGRKPYNVFLTGGKLPVSLTDQAITGKMVDSLWLDYLDHRNATQTLFTYGYLSGPDVGQLRISADTTSKGEPVFVKSVLLFRQGDPDFLRIYNGNRKDLGNLQQGQYRLLLLLKNDRYLLKEGIQIKPGGVNYYSCGPIVSRPADSMSRAIAAMINSRDYAVSDSESDYSADTIKRAFNNRYFQLDANAKLVSGLVTTGSEPLGGIMVTVRNTGIATVTDMQGYFSIRVPDRGMLVVSGIGYETREIVLDNNIFYEVKLKETTQSLNEVVVVGYGMVRKREMTGSISSISSSSIEGRLAGVVIRGSTSVSALAKPLVVIDGLPVDIDPSQLDESTIANIEILKADKATAIYGARASAGVIIVTTKRKAVANAGFDTPPDETKPGNSLRTNFRDEAYWFPSLRTDQHGKASAKVVFPDNITNWRTYAIAMTDNRLSGLATGNVRSFKAISGTLYLPNFAVSGDEMHVLGKAMNYLQDSLDLKRVFSVNGKEVKGDVIGVRNSRVDTFAVTATSDTMKLAYTIQRQDGYFDGEEKKLPIFPQGVLETHGMFAAMDRDTTVNWQPVQGSEVTVHAEASALPVLMDEIEYLYRYEYSCNEQLASRLKALLLKKKVYALQQKEFDQNKQVREIISKLNKSKSTDNLWGWWKGGESQPWITQHVVEALLLAEQQKLAIEINRNVIRDYLIYSLGRTPLRISVMIPKLRAIRQLDAKILFKPWLDSLAKKDTARSLYETLSLLAFQQELEKKEIPDSLLRKRNLTVFGNMYWGEEGYRFFDNSVQNTLLMYRILKADGNYAELLKKIRRYFLEKRRDGHWRNTYESILILETILPDLLEEPSFNTASSLVLRQGDQSQTISSYPVTLKFNSRETINVEKKGPLPVYFTASQEKWNPDPKKVDSTFSVRSFFIQGRDTVTWLKAGQPVTLQVQVKVTADASYVMLEIPIPAGCSYNNKQQYWQNNEVNREYFLNKVSLFCNELKKGTYTFSVSLLPRYSGNYNLNPAKASMMYFPVFFGREGMKKINIR